MLQRSFSICDFALLGSSTRTRTVFPIWLGDLERWTPRFRHMRGFQLVRHIRLLQHYPRVKSLQIPDIAALHPSVLDLVSCCSAQYGSRSSSTHAKGASPGFQFGMRCILTIVAQADKAAGSAGGGFSMFGGRTEKWENAADLYTQAANAFRMQKQSMSASATS
jgi:Soluble NSF attachment protein, SNAP